MMKHYLLFILLLLGSLQRTDAQDLTGTWEGTLSNDERLRVYVVKKKKELCGYTADYVMRRPSSYCKANFKGWYDEEQDVWVLVGTSFIENSGDHILMLLRLWHEAGDPPNVMRGTEEAKYGSSMFPDRSPLRIRKISSEVPAELSSCFPKIIRPPAPKKQREVTIVPSVKPKPATDPVQKPVVKPKQATPRPPVAPAIVKAKPVIKEKPIVVNKKPVTIAREDSAKASPKIFTPTIPAAADPDMTRKMMERKRNEFSHLIVNDKNITLKVYDNGIVDNDSVSIFYNGKLIAGKKKLSEKPITIQLQLDEQAPLHEIVLFAENLGSIPPNTALVVVTAGDKRYELHSSASLTENAVLTFEYKPK